MNKAGNAKAAVELLRDFFVDDSYSNLKNLSNRMEYNNSENDLGFFYQKDGGNSLAIEHFNAVVKHDPNRTVVWLNLGDSY